MDRQTCIRRVLIAVVAAALIAPLAAPAMPVAAESAHHRAGSEFGDPHPGPAVPFIGGIISTAAGLPIAGANVLLLQLGGLGTTVVQVTATNEDGRYAFGANGLAEIGLYVVYVPTEGVLSGWAPTAATRNPSDVIAGAVGNLHVDMAFQ